MNASQRMKAAGALPHRRQISEASTGMATMIQVNALTPSAHHTGNAANSTTSGQVTGTRGRATVLRPGRDSGPGAAMAPDPATGREHAAHVDFPLERDCPRRRPRRRGAHPIPSAPSLPGTARTVLELNAISPLAEADV